MDLSLFTNSDILWPIVKGKLCPSRSVRESPRDLAISDKKDFGDPDEEGSITLMRSEHIDSRYMYASLT